MTEHALLQPHRIGPNDAVILLGRGGVGTAGRKQLQATVDALASQTEAMVGLAFVDRLAPSLPDALDACAAAHRVVIAPVYAPDDPALRRWLHKIVLRWRDPSASAPQIFFAPPLLSAPTIADVFLSQLEGAMSEPFDVSNDADGDGDWQKDPAGWSSVPAHQHHVLWCTGPRCAAKGALSLWPQLSEVVQGHPVLKRDIMLLQTTCQYPCNHGPMMIVYPAGAWYGPLNRGDFEPILTQHVTEGRVAHERCFHRLGGDETQGD